jgi:putative Holliday junction resolvase
MKFQKKILAVDPGEKNIGLAVSDPFGISASPLEVIRHTNRDTDAQTIAAKASENGAEMILVGQALGPDGEIGSSARHALKVAEAIRSCFSGEVILWDESGSTKAVKAAYIEMNIPKLKRRGHLDAAAAAWILQDYLDFKSLQSEFDEKDPENGS